MQLNLTNFKLPVCVDGATLFYLGERRYGGNKWPRMVKEVLRRMGSCIQYRTGKLLCKANVWRSALHDTEENLKMRKMAYCVVMLNKLCAT